MTDAEDGVSDETDGPGAARGHDLAAVATIVIPSYGRPGPLAKCLAALAELEGGPYRVIVVDDGSPEALEPVCAAAGDRVSCLRQENAGPGVARNRGVEAAETELVLFTDDDCHPRPDWARRMIAAQGGAAWRLVGGAVENALARNLFSATSQSILSYAYEAFGGFEGPFAFFTTNNICCRREDFLALGGFDTAFAFASEDRDFSRRWQDAGGALVHVPEAVVEHHHHLDAKGFWKQHWLYGRGARQFHAKLAATGGPDVSLNSSGFYAGLLLHPLRRPGPRALALSTLIGTAHAIQLAGYLTQRRSERRA